MHKIYRQYSSYISHISSINVPNNILLFHFDNIRQFALILTQSIHSTNILFVKLFVYWTNITRINYIILFVN